MIGVNFLRSFLNLHSYDGIVIYFYVLKFQEEETYFLGPSCVYHAISLGEQKTLMQQFLSGLNHMHDLWILHRDLKTSNLLLSHSGVLKVISTSSIVCFSQFFLISDFFRNCTGLLFNIFL